MTQYSGVSGEMAQGEMQQGGLDAGTLDEPILDTVKRDVYMVLTKFKYVLKPAPGDKNLLHDWDLWGPLILCITLAISLRGGAKEGQEGLVFSGIFVIVWCGAGIVTLNARLLGGTLSFFQSVCVLGYCILPLTIAALLNFLMALSWVTYYIIRPILILLALIWSIYASLGFLGVTQPPNRKALAVYPIFLFYFVIAWLVLIQPR
eukprot:Clim_evm15s34 gene=Clim_evmTU15s34